MFCCRKQNCEDSPYPNILNPPLRPNAQRARGQSQDSPKSPKTFTIWCSGRDLNPGRRIESPAYSRPVWRPVYTTGAGGPRKYLSVKGSPFPEDLESLMLFLALGSRPATA